MVSNIHQPNGVRQQTSGVNHCPLEGQVTPNLHKTCINVCMGRQVIHGGAYVSSEERGEIVDAPSLLVQAIQ